MKRFGKLRKYIARLLSGVGTVMAILTIGELQDYHESSEQYWQRAESIMDRLTKFDLPPEQVTDRDMLIQLFHSKLTPEEFKQHIAMINRTYNDHITHITPAERFELSSGRSFLRLSNRESFMLKYASFLLFGGFALIALGVFLERKKEPKPETPPPPRQPWESVSPPVISKGSCYVPEH